MVRPLCYFGPMPIRRLTPMQRAMRRQMAEDILPEIAEITKLMFTLNNSVAAMTEDDGLQYLEVSAGAAQKVQNGINRVNVKLREFRKRGIYRRLVLKSGK